MILRDKILNRYDCFPEAWDQYVSHMIGKLLNDAFLQRGLWETEGWYDVQRGIEFPIIQHVDDAR